LAERSDTLISVALVLDRGRTKWGRQVTLPEAGRIPEIDAVLGAISQGAR
jgi:hypothetical protein